MLARMLGAARLDIDTYEDVEKDKGATLQALLVVVSSQSPPVSAVC